MEVPGLRGTWTRLFFSLVLLWGSGAAAEAQAAVRAPGGGPSRVTHHVRRWTTHAPAPKTVFSFQVKEDTAPGSVVGKLPGPGPPTSTPTPTYSVQRDDGESLFLLRPLSGEFLLSRGLDFESRGLYVLTVAERRGESGLSGVRVYFNVLDVNDNAPVFRPDDRSAELPEDAPPGSCFLPLNVSDDDDGANGNVDLSVTAGDEDGVFFVSPAGVLCLNAELDRERRSSYNLTVTAVDRAQTPSLRLTSSAHVSVLVGDVNDNPPSFMSAQSVALREDSALGSVVMTVRAEDADAGSNGDVFYHLDDDARGRFTIDNASGRLSLQKPLDREQTDVLTITVTATDGGSPPLASSTSLTVHVEDVNDHDPEFSRRSFSLALSEGVPRGTAVLHVQTRDLDIGANGQVRYALSSGGPFAVDAVRGLVTVMDELDREKVSNYTLVLTAVDRGRKPRSSTALISVSVLDDNDFTPLFSPATQIVHVMENEGDLSLLTQQVLALDEDLGVNSQLTYSIQRGNEEDYFNLSPNGTFRPRHSLDREKEPLYTLTIIAVDAGSPPLTGTVTLHVIVDDVNDNTPQFLEDGYNTIVPEDSPPGTVFAVVSASDIDEGASGEIRYSVADGDSPFSIEATSGELFTTDILDRETVAMYQLTVIGSDKHPTDPLSSSVLVTVLVGDVNDHWPQFLNSPYVAHVPSEMDPGSVICAVRAVDRDAEMNAELKFSLYGPSAGLFSIDAHSGTVFSVGAIKRTKGLTINVRVEDGGEAPKSDVATVTVRFHNASEFPAVHVDVIMTVLSEEEPVGTRLALVSATSLRTEGRVSFYLVSGDAEAVFGLDQSSGELTVRTPLDYENNKHFALLIEARDWGSPPFSSFQELDIDIGDVNDNSPMFTQSEYRCEVFENSPAMALVCGVVAIDADSGSYGSVRYSIADGNTDSAFIIDPESGELSTTRSLDREYIPKYNLSLEAVDQDNPLHRDRAIVLAVVLDRNDHAPRFSQIFVAEIAEDAPVGHTVIQVVSTDDDTDAHSQIAYSIIDQSGDTPFGIDSASGCITVAKPLDREKQNRYAVRVNANDSAWSVSTDVAIAIADVNDNKPVFSHHSPLIVILPENKPQDVFVTQVTATDADAGKKGQIFYVIEPPNDYFWVNASSGEVFTAQPMTSHNSASEDFGFTVFAYDCGRISLFSNTTVTVRLVPYNYYPPTFSPFPQKIAIPFDTAVGTRVLQFTALDRDYNHSSTDIEYILNGGHAAGIFQIHRESGTLMLNQSLREHITEVFTLSVTANDWGFPPLSSQAEITFEITPRNTFAPHFSESETTFSVPEDLPVGSVIGKTQAEDGDYSANGDLTYSINPENERLPFSLGNSSALLTVIRDLDFEEEAGYHFQIKAVDGGWISKTGWINITVNIVDVNDNPPVFSAYEYVASVPENSGIGTTVFHLKATDADSGTNSQIIYSLIAGHVDRFAVDSRNGTITTMDVFDYEREQMFDVTVKASNVGARPLFSVAHVIVQIHDVNEFTPTFETKEHNFSILSNAPIGTRIGRVTASDLDGGYEGQVFYLAFGPNKNMGFDVKERSGEIYSTASFRRQGNSHAVLQVLAKNRGVVTGLDVDETSVRISIIDTNGAPEFTSDLYLANVKEDSLTGTSLCTVSALDQDSILAWSSFTFSIESGDHNSSFAVHPLSGIISVNSPLDRELWPLYNLTVIATDNGSPPATGTANILVTIDDVNDNAPILTMTEAQVKENQPQGTVVARLNASDSDLRPNQGPFTFWFVPLSIGSVFSLTADGVLFTTRPLDRELKSLYHVVVAVRDAGIPPLSSTTMFNISILDENDNPTFQRNIHIEVKYFGSSFQGGLIGNVHPEDEDESDTFNCSIRSGLFSMFEVPHGTCELWSAAFEGEATYNITIEATDQLHFPVNNSIYVNYKGFTNASMESCILFYVSMSSVEEFLTNKYRRFIKALDSLFNLQASKTHVFGIKVFGAEILLLAAVKSYNGQYLSREVASGISAGHRKLLESQSDVTISHITSDPCVTDPCRNGARCSKNIHIGPDAVVLESPAVIFVSPQLEIFNCSCPVGFAGPLCEADIDECEGNPCQNEGTCVNNPGGFHCHCQRGFSGPSCAADVDGVCPKEKCRNGGTCVQTHDGFRCQCSTGYEGDICAQLVDHCKSVPCVHGKCINSPTGFSCRCPFGVGGVLCEEHSFGFEELSFMELPPLDPRSNLISLECATVQQDSLLLFNPGGSSSRDFFALEILDRRLHLSYDLGSGPVRLVTEKNVADGRFHSITARRIGNIGSILVDNCKDVDTEGFCFSQSDGLGTERMLDVGSSNMTFGGLRTIESISTHSAQIRTHDFVGCVRNINVNGVVLRPSTALAAYNILERCPRAPVPPCQSSPCENGGRCQDLWSGYFCQCQPQYSGINCDKEISEGLVLRLSAGAYIEYVFKERFKRDFLLEDLQHHGFTKETESSRNPTEVHLKFKTERSGVLLSFLGTKGHTMLAIKDRKLQYLSTDGSGRLLPFAGESPVADGLWHVVALSSSRQNTLVLLDGNPVVNAANGALHLSPVSLIKMVLGGSARLDSKPEEPGLSGCVEYLKVAGSTLPLSGHSEMVEVRPGSALVRPSCRAPASCLPTPCVADRRVEAGCLSGPCRSLRKCARGTHNTTCICLHNATDLSCDVCTSAWDDRDTCSGPQSRSLLWLIGVILPVSSVSVIAAALCFLRRRGARDDPRKYQSEAVRGMDNSGFCLDGGRARSSAGAGEEFQPPDVILAKKPSPAVGFYGDADPSYIKPVTQSSELEYYEIESYSICTTFPSASASPKQTQHGPKHIGQREKPNKCRDFQTPLSQDGGSKFPLSTQGLPLPSAGTELHCPQYLEPVRGLSAEEVRQLNASRKPVGFCRRQRRPSPPTSATTDGFLSDSETGSTFTGSEFECAQFSVTAAKDQREISENAPIETTEQWEYIVCTHTPRFSTFAEVFEDIASLPVERNSDVQTDLEAII